MTGSNRRPSACKADALPAELITLHSRSGAHSTSGAMRASGGSPSGSSAASPTGSGTTCGSSRPRIRTTSGSSATGAARRWSRGIRRAIARTTTSIPSNSRANAKGATPNEAETALRQAAILKRQFDLSDAEISAHTVETACVPTRTRRSPAPWLHELAGICASSFGCDYLSPAASSRRCATSVTRTSWRAAWRPMSP